MDKPLVAGGLYPLRKIERMSERWNYVTNEMMKLVAEGIIEASKAEAKAEAQMRLEEEARMKAQSLAIIEKQFEEYLQKKRKEFLEKQYALIGREFEKNKAKRAAEAAREAEASHIRASELREKGRLAKVEAAEKAAAAAAKEAEKKRVADMIKKVEKEHYRKYK